MSHSEAGLSSITEIANQWVSNLAVYEPGKPIDEVARELGYSNADEIIKLASNENALGPSPLAIKAMLENAARMNIYPDGGTFYLRHKIAEKLDVEPSMVLPGNGSNELIELAAHVFAGPGRKILMADRAFIVYRLVAAMFRSDLTAVPMIDHTHDLEAMLEAVDDQTTLIFIANPNNPTGTMVGQQEIDRFMERVPESAVVCFDEAYIDFVPADVRPDTLKYVREGRNVIVLRTFSKSYGLAGLRIGFAVATNECIALLNRVRQPFNVNAMAMEAAAAALDDDEHIERMKDLVSKGLSFFSSEFKEMGLESIPSFTNFIMVRTGEGRKVFELMQNEGVIVRPMDVYGMPDYIRVTIGTETQNLTAVTKLRKVLSVLNG